MPKSENLMVLFIKAQLESIYIVVNPSESTNVISMLSICIFIIHTYFIEFMTPVSCYTYIVIECLIICTNYI